MPYRLDNAETVPDGLRRCAREQLDIAIAELTEGVQSDPVKAVHRARKALKKERSLLRLGRDAFAPGARRREARVLRGVAQDLSAARDADVMVQTLDELADRFAGQVPEVSFAVIRERLELQRDGARLQLVNSASIGDAAAELIEAGRRLEGWPIRGGGWRVVGAGLSRSYRRGRRASRKARANPTPENLHAWRKRTKDVWYELRLLAPIAPGTMRGQAKEAHRLSDLLGDDHDLSELRPAIARIGGDIPADVGSVIGLIDHRQDQLRADAFFAGERLYAETPKAMRRRVRRYWETWRAEGRAASSRRPAELADQLASATVH